MTLLYNQSLTLPFIPSPLLFVPPSFLDNILLNNPMHLTDEQWCLIEPILPPPSPPDRGRPPLRYPPGVLRDAARDRSGHRLRASLHSALRLAPACQKLRDNGEGVSPVPPLPLSQTLPIQAILTTQGGGASPTLTPTPIFLYAGE